MFLKVKLIFKSFVAFLCMVSVSPIVTANNSMGAWDLFLNGQYKQALESIEQQDNKNIPDSNYLKFLLSEAYIWNNRMPLATKEGRNSLSELLLEMNEQAFDDLAFHYLMNARYGRRVQELVNLISRWVDLPNGNHDTYIGKLIGLGREPLVFKHFPEYQGVTEQQLYERAFLQNKDVKSAIVLTDYLKKRFHNIPELDAEIIKELETIAELGVDQVVYILSFVYEKEEPAEVGLVKFLENQLLAKKLGYRVSSEMISEKIGATTEEQVKRINEAVDKQYSEISRAGSFYTAATEWCFGSKFEGIALDFCKEFSTYHHLYCYREIPVNKRPYSTSSPYRDCRINLASWLGPNRHRKQ